MSQEDTLRLILEAVDKFSPEMKKFVAALKGIDESGKNVHQRGVKHATEHEQAYKKLREQLMKVKDTASDVLRPAFNALGVTVLSIAGSIAAVSEAVKSFGEYGQKLEFAHRASGLLTGTVRGLAEANQRFGVSTEQTIKSLEEFGAHMDEFKRDAPDYINAWKRLGGNALRDIGSPIKALAGDREAQLKKAMEIIPTIRDVDQRKRILAILGLPENWAYLTTREMQEMRKRAAEFNTNFPFNAEAAKNAQAAWEDLLTTLRGMRDEMSGTFAPAVTEALKSIDAFAKDPEWAAIGKIFHDIKQDVDDIASIFPKWTISGSPIKSDLQDIESILKGVHWLLDLYKPHPDKDKTPFVAPGGLEFGGPSGIFGGKDQQKTQESIRKGTKEGLEDFYHALQGANQGYTPMAFHPGGGGGAQRGGYFGSKEYPAIDDKGITSGGGRHGLARHLGMDRAGSGATGEAPSGEVESAYLAKQRAAIFAKIDADPNLRDQVAATLGHEGNTKQQYQATLESMVNRMAYKGTTNVMKELDSGFYGPRNRGEVGRANKGMLSGYDWAAGRVRRGSDIIGMRTDQGTWGSEVQQGVAGGENVGGEGYADWPSHNPRAWPRAQAWRMRQEAAKKASDLRDAMESSRAAHGASLRDMVSRGHRPPGDAELLRRGQRSDAGRLDGNAHLSIDLNGFPRGTRTAHKADGIFKQVTLNRGRPMNAASES